MTVEDRYFDWLVSQIELKSGRYTGMLKRVHRKEFVWIVPNDDNRIEDARELRREFLGEAQYVFQNGVSVLEVLLGLSRRMEFIAGGEAAQWAWTLLDNLELTKFRDPLRNMQAVEIEDILEAVVWRMYKPNGQGGFFPLIDTEEDQTQVELWYQMGAYLQEVVNLT